MFLRFLFALLVATGFAVQAANAQTLSLKPFKDDLFAYPATLSTGDNGAYTVLDYHEMRDINQRDQVPEKRVRAQYTDPGVRKVQQDLMLKSDAGDIRHVAVGKTEGASIIVLYLHGQGGSRKQGVDDFTFGGNFNRIKNLMAANNGLYLSPDFPDFGDKGAGQVAALIDHYAQQSPGAKIFVACGSMGGMICWKLAARNDTGRRINGLLLLGSLWDESFLSSPAFRRHVPVFFGQGSHDVVFPVEKQEAFFRSIIAKSKAYPYPTRFVRFETGTHGTPIRMVDWRGTLNWMLTKAP
ncbi:alpha/beta hydrolase [Mesorhizobium sp. CU2]|uniref:alpha/beta hydrolase n=1 Tax=unclassified Mesorhizobium TaxID=325217 RepID=UPI00112A9F20|nr:MULTISPECIES: alpha/beta hydrolase [unclassified Mesorhizobium]TPN88613.1 alpha/beta hydrolase [Mesorhizobium sp. CU3]TPO08119.1 alpha/beta hydrolase [Mesorhizobium sp. CU2]